LILNNAGQLAVLGICFSEMKGEIYLCPDFPTIIPRLGLFDMVDMKEELEKIFGREVDIVEKEGIRNPFRRREIPRTREVIYAA